MVRDEIVVLDIAGASARVACGKDEAEAALIALGFLHQGQQMVRKISDDGDRRNLVRALIGLKALFASGRDWSPADLVDFYREQGVILTGYRMITWENPNQYSVVDR